MSAGSNRLGYHTLIAALTFALLAQQLWAQETRPLVLILAGQSNMAAPGRTDDLAAAEKIGPSNVRYFLGPDQIQPSQSPRFGPELALGQTLGAAMPARTIVLIKHAVPGTSLLAWAPDWDSTRANVTGNANAGPLYRQLLEIIRGAQLPPGSELGAVLWMQGERDARFDEAARLYFENLSAMIAALRRDLQEPNLPFILGLVNPPSDQYPAVERVRAAQRRAAKEIPNVYLVETDGLSKRDDRLHYDAKGTLELGRRFGNAVLALRRRDE